MKSRARGRDQALVGSSETVCSGLPAGSRSFERGHGVRIDACHYAAYSVFIMLWRCLRRIPATREHPSGLGIHLVHDLPWEVFPSSAGEDVGPTSFGAISTMSPAFGSSDSECWPAFWIDFRERIGGHFAVDGFEDGFRPAGTQFLTIISARSAGCLSFQLA
jgi:hypothetical protein